MNDEVGRKKPGACRSGGSRLVDKHGKVIKETMPVKKKTEKVKPATKPADSEE